MADTVETVESADPEIHAIEARAKAGGVQMAGVLREAGVAQSTWLRWRRGVVAPTLPTLRKVQGALDARLTDSAHDRAA